MSKDFEKRLAALKAHTNSYKILNTRAEIKNFWDELLESDSISMYTRCSFKCDYIVYLDEECICKTYLKEVDEIPSFVDEVYVPDVEPDVRSGFDTEFLARNSNIKLSKPKSNFDCCYEMFCNVKCNSISLVNFDASNVTAMGYMFANCCVMSHIEWGTFDTSNVIDMGGMFANCKIDKLDLSMFDTSCVVNMQAMFVESEIKNLNLYGFDISKLEHIAWMFAESKIKNLDLSSFDFTILDRFENDKSSIFEGATIEKIIVADEKQVALIKDIVPKQCKLEVKQKIDIAPFYITTTEKKQSTQSTVVHDANNKQNEVKPQISLSSGVHSTITQYTDKQGIILLDIVQEIPKIYNISNRALSRLLGWGDSTFNKIYNGELKPTKQYSDVLLRLYKDARQFLLLLESNKIRITEIQFRNCKSIVEARIAKQYNAAQGEKIDSVVRYIYGLCGSITLTAVQKLLYYIQGFHLVFAGKPLFEEDCLASKHGIIYPTVYNKYKTYAVDLDKLEQIKFKASGGLTLSERQLIEWVCYSFGCFSDMTLYRFISQGSPYIKAREQSINTSVNPTIAKSAIANYFTTVRNKYAIANLNDLPKYSKALISDVIGG